MFCKPFVCLAIVNQSCFYAIEFSIHCDTLFIFIVCKFNTLFEKIENDAIKMSFVC